VSPGFAETRCVGEGLRAVIVEPAQEGGKVAVGHGGKRLKKSAGPHEADRKNG
jgi:hypothetical protein